METTSANSPRAAVLRFIEDFGGQTGSVADNADLFDALAIWGDDASDFIERFVARFGVEAEDYRWYFHHDEEGWSLGALFFKPPHQRFGRIPITVAILTEAARTRRWPIDYPEHVLPQRRWDMLINQVLAGLSLAGLAVWGGMAFLDRYASG